MSPRRHRDAASEVVWPSWFTPERVDAAQTSGFTCGQEVFDFVRSIAPDDREWDRLPVALTGDSYDRYLLMHFAGVDAETYQAFRRCGHGSIDRIYHSLRVGMTANHVRTVDAFVSQYTRTSSVEIPTGFLDGTWGAQIETDVPALLNDLMIAGEDGERVISGHVTRVGEFDWFVDQALLISVPDPRVRAVFMARYHGMFSVNGPALARLWLDPDMPVPTIERLYTSVADEMRPLFAASVAVAPSVHLTAALRAFYALVAAS